ncbi:MAG: hypothetical protein K2X73_10515 [Sphingomonas sp.]|jgi:hypothetical protein|uniref:DUF2946 family protein n=1 Tax=Sphingomonas sp. TaxID=28214 RepID=UPI0025FDAAFC|nr:DUF2946 family protein [Sphingomonas sp.]MBX9882392.1 hypothetical protein [Sphingomonas sp.]
MRGLRAFCGRHRAAAATLIAFALLIRALVPGGLMPHFGDHGLRLVVCSGAATGVTIDVPLGGPQDHQDSPAGDSHKLAPCGFAGLAAPVLGGPPPLLLALAILAAFGAVLRRRDAPSLPASAALRPPLRGPPALA